MLTRLVFVCATLWTDVLVSVRGSAVHSEHQYIQTHSTTSPLFYPDPVCNIMARAPVIALSHGGGPMPLLGDPNHAAIVKSLKTRVPAVLKLGTPDAPRAIVVVTAHWEERDPTISTAARHPLLFDYYNFPPESYNYKYEAPGSPEIAEEVVRLLEAEGLKPQRDDERGWDHGVFVPMLLVHPEASIPIVQVSVLADETSPDHFRMGRALSKLRNSNVAIVGSGFASFHNFRHMASGLARTPEFKAKNTEWNTAVTDAITEPDSKLREEKLLKWRQFPNAYAMHPQAGAEHFFPLLVCAGAGGDAKAKTYSDAFQGLDIWSYYWDD